MLYLAYAIWIIVFIAAVVGCCYFAGVLVLRAVRWNDRRRERAWAYRARMLPRRERLSYLEELRYYDKPREGA